MAAPDIACSECGTVVPNKSGIRKTCSQRCRAKRQRRLARLNKESSERASLSPELAALRAAIDDKAGDELHKLIQDEAKPFVREALNEQVVAHLQKMIGLVPAAIEAVAADLLNPDPKLRAKAYELILKYSLGNPSVAPDKADDHGPVTVNFNLPRSEADVVVDATSEEVKPCEICGKEKPESEFQDGSERCVQCFNEMRDNVKGLIEEDASH